MSVIVSTTCRFFYVTDAISLKITSVYTKIKIPGDFIILVFHKIPDKLLVNFVRVKE